MQTRRSFMVFLPIFTFYACVRKLTPTAVVTLRFSCWMLIVSHFRPLLEQFNLFDTHESLCLCFCMMIGPEKLPFWFFANSCSYMYSWVKDCLVVIQGSCILLENQLSGQCNKWTGCCYVESNAYFLYSLFKNFLFFSADQYGRFLNSF